MAAATGTTQPSRARKTAAAKAAPAKAAAAPKAAAPEEITRLKVELVHVGDTKQYAKFQAPEELAGVVVGNLYAPLGTARIVAMVVGPGDTGDE